MWCVPNAAILEDGRDAAPVYDTTVTSSSIDARCLFSDCTGIVSAAPACPSGYIDYDPPRTLDECGKESGFATAGRQCDPEKGFYQTRWCKAGEPTSVFMNWSWSTDYVNDEFPDGKCLPQKARDNKFPTCFWCMAEGAEQKNGAQNNAALGGACYDMFTQNLDGTCLEYASQDGGELRTIGNPTDATGQSERSAIDLSNPVGVGAGASLPVVGAAVIGLAVWGKKKGMKKRSLGEAGEKLKKAQAGDSML
jgi:hypothetical protein